MAYDMSQLSSEIFYGYAGDTLDKKKIQLYAEEDFGIWWAYWSHKENTWKTKAIFSDGTTEERTQVNGPSFPN
jgi:hypothetical protein